MISQELNCGASVKAIALATAVLILATQAAGAQQSAGFLTDLATSTDTKDRLFYHKVRDWFVNCTYTHSSETGRCELESSLSSLDEKLAKMFRIQIVISDRKAPPLAILRTPLDLHLSKGVDMRVGKSLVGKLTYRSCHTSGCIVPFSMIGQINRRLIRGTRATFEFHQLRGKQIRLELSLLGISAALKAARNFL